MSFIAFLIVVCLYEQSAFAMISISSVNYCYRSNNSPVQPLHIIESVSFHPQMTNSRNGDTIDHSLSVTRAAIGNSFENSKYSFSPLALSFCTLPSTTCILSSDLTWRESHTATGWVFVEAQ